MHLLQSCDLLWGLLHGPSHMDQSLAGRARLIVTDELVADQTFINDIIKHIEEQGITTNDDDVIMEGLRVAVRNPALASIFSSHRVVFEKLLESSGFHKPEQFEIVEATKACLNILHHMADLRQAVLSGDYYQQSLEAFLHVKYYCPDLFWRLRFFFLCTAERNGAEMVAAHPAFLQNLIQMAIQLASLEKQKEDAQKCLCENLKILFNVSAQIGLKSELQMDLVAFIKSILKGDDPIKIKIEALGILMNIQNAELLKNLLPTGKLIEIFDQAMLLEADPANKIHIDAVILALDKLVSADEALRHQLRKALLPSKWDRNVKPEAGDGIKARIIRLLRSDDQNIAQSTGKFLLDLVKGKVLLLIYHVGYGNAAGFLFNNGMLGAYQGELQAMAGKSKPTEDLSSDEDEFWERKLEGINPVTGQAQDTLPTAGEDMTEEEKEAESKRLLDLFDRLDKTGIIKAIPLQKPE